MTVALMMEKNSVVAYSAPNTLVRPACVVLQQEHRGSTERITLSAISSEAEAMNSVRLSSQPGCRCSRGEWAGRLQQKWGPQPSTLVRPHRVPLLHVQGCSAGTHNGEAACMLCTARARLTSAENEDECFCRMQMPMQHEV